jgi:hypothetical protein
VSGKKLPPPSTKGGFVVNLAASTTPVTLVQPSHAALKAYTFFVSRRREDGRERFRLHMGYFESQHDAEQMLDAVRDIFPAAWAGVAPGRKLAAEAAGVRVASPAPLAIPQVRVAPAAVPPPPVAAAAAAQRAAVAAAAPVSKPPATGPAVSASQPQPQPQPQSPPQPQHSAANASLDSVRAAIASLDDESRAALELKRRADASTAERKLLSETQTMRLLESRRLQEQADKARRDVAAPPIADFAGYVVQLRWSTRPIDVSQLPAMAIFDAYTLYSAEGSNGAQPWHGLRLGFFNDADSARQVASYVRSEFPSVSVVPISTDERTGAQNAVRGTLAAKAAPSARASGEFRLIDDVKAPAAGTPPVTSSPQATTPQPATLQAASQQLPVQQPPVAKPKGKSAKLPARGAGKSQTTERRPPLTIEETLEILGANTLTLETKRPGGLNGATSAAMLHAARRKSPQKSRLGLLFEKLAERISG